MEMNRHYGVDKEEKSPCAFDSVFDNLYTAHRVCYNYSFDVFNKWYDGQWWW